MAWWNNKKDSVVETESAEASKQAVWTDETSKAIADARKAQRGRVAGTKKGEQASDTTQARVDLPSGMVEQAKKLFSPDSWRAIVKAPFALGQAMTGRECWQLEKEKEDTLAVSTAMTAEYFMVTDPKWVAVTLCAFNWSVILAEKYAANTRERKKEEALNPKPPENPQTPTHVLTMQRRTHDPQPS